VDVGLGDVEPGEDRLDQRRVVVLVARLAVHALVLGPRLAEAVGHLRVHEVAGVAAHAFASAG
jgi:hypothetical protein